ncbi:sulfurtransferase TusA family protein [Natronospora cellulosivora (SeqCode)]
MDNNEPFFRIPETVKEDTENYASLVDDFVSGKLEGERFKGYRVPMGVYGQRSNDDQELYMVRVRIPGGVLNKEQLELLNEIAKEYGAGFLHFTTREDIQIHQVRIEDTPRILKKLLNVGLSPRGGGGNTVRNILNSSRAGVKVDDVFDTTPHALALSEYLLKERSSFNLPRKYKIAFSSSTEDDALATVNDLGFIAKYKDGKKGFKVYAAGGMGNNPQPAIIIDDFVTEDKIFHVAEAIKRFFDDYGDRSNKHKARLRFVRERLGEKAFVEKYREYLEKVLAEDIEVEEIRFFQEKRNEIENDQLNQDIIEKYQDKDYFYQEKDKGYYSIELRPVNGDIDYKEVKEIIELISNLNNEIRLRTTRYQGFVIRGISVQHINDLIKGIDNINENLLAASIATVPIACKGASTCRLGLCLSPELAKEIRNSLLELDEEFNSLLPKIYISGCPNACGQHFIGPIGLEGKASRNEGKLVPHYALLLGGKIGEEKAQLAERVVDIPAKRVPAFLKKLAEYLAEDKDYQGKENFNDYLENGGSDKIIELASQFTEIPSYQENPDIYKDWSQSEDFNLQGRGPGECGMGVLDIIKVDIDSAKSKLISSEDDELYQGIINIARALLVIRGFDNNKDRLIVKEFKKEFIDKGFVDEKYLELLDVAIDYKLGDEEDLSKYKNLLEELIERVEFLYNSLNARLEFDLEDDNSQQTSKKALDEEKDSNVKESDENSNKDNENLNEDNEGLESKETFKDLRGVMCPMNFVKAKLFIEPMEVGTVVDFYLDDGAPIENVPGSLIAEGHKILVKEKTAEGYYHLKVEKGQ